MEIKYRPEIDGLRAVAVLAVVIYHAEFVLGGHKVLPGGFLGVDVFFVISGFLITSLMMKELNSTGRISIGDFYEKRARRLLPVLFVVMAATIPFAWKHLLPAQMVDFSSSLFFSLFFGSNFYWDFSLQKYGAESGTLKPLLHTWSLAVEEQYYIVYPLILLAIYRWFKANVIVLLTAGFLLSLQFSEWMTVRDSSFSFYMLPSRFWELLAGGLLANILHLHPQKDNDALLNRVMPIFGLYLIVYSIVFFDFEEMKHPGFATLIPVVGTVLIIWFANEKDLVTRVLSSKGFVSLGLVSYSFYLWHYPVFSFARIKDDARSNYDMLELLVASLVLAIISYFLIEKPFRNRARIGLRYFALFSVGLVMVFSAFYFAAVKTDGVLGRYSEGQLKFLNLDRGKGGDFTKYVTSAYNSEANNAQYKNNDLPKLLLIGDSYSQDFYNILSESRRLEGVDVISQYISKRCHNVPSKTPSLTEKLTAESLRACKSAVRVGSQKLRNRLRDADGVILASSWNAYTIKNLPSLVETVKEAGVKNVLVVGKKNFGTLSTKMLVEMTAEELLVFLRQPSDSFLEQNNHLSNRFGDEYLDFFDLMCSEKNGCPISTPNGFLISYDGSHLTEEGARLLGKKLNDNAAFVGFWQALTLNSM